MPDTASHPVQFTEDRIPREGIEETVSDLIELYGGELTESRENERRFTLPLRRGIAAAGGVECTVSWAAGEAGDAVVTLVCNRDVDAPKAQRIALLVAGVIGSLLFMIWPFFAHSKRARRTGLDRRHHRAGRLLHDAAQDQRRHRLRFPPAPGQDAAQPRRRGRIVIWIIVPLLVLVIFGLYVRREAERIRAADLRPRIVDQTQTRRRRHGHAGRVARAPGARSRDREARHRHDRRRRVGGWVGDVAGGGGRSEVAAEQLRNLLQQRGLSDRAEISA